MSHSTKVLAKLPSNRLIRPNVPPGDGEEDNLLDVPLNMTSTEGLKIYMPHPPLREPMRPEKGERKGLHMSSGRNSLPKFMPISFFRRVFPF